MSISASSSATRRASVAVAVGSLHSSRALARRPLTDDEQVPGVVEILDQLVREVAVELRHVAPDCLGDRSTLLYLLGGEMRLPDGIDRHRCPPRMSMHNGQKL